MNSSSVSAYSLADFFFPDSDDPLMPSQDFADWKRETSWATSLYEQSLVNGPVPRALLMVDKTPQPVINLASYNYLGLAKHSETIAAAKEALDRYGTGACGSPILSGMTDLHRELEERLSQFVNREQTMLFNSGFGGALGMLSGLLRRGDVAILDSKSHISLIDGAKLSGARIALFEHNDAESLDALLTKYADRRRIVVTEGIFSMDGDMADLSRIVPVAEQHGVGIVVDEAHSILTCGENGRGVTDHFGVDDKVLIKYATFSKAFGAIGGFVSGPDRTLDYLRYYSNPYGFSCALPPSVIATILASLRIATRDSSRRDKMQENSVYFRTQLNDLGISTGNSVSQVIPLIIGSDQRLLYELGVELRARGLFIPTVDYPSVPEDSLRFRASITSEHTRQDLDEALNIIEDTVVRRLKKE